MALRNTKNSIGRRRVCELFSGVDDRAPMVGYDAYAIEGNCHVVCEGSSRSE
jgi:hypothetical protein